MSIYVMRLTATTDNGSAAFTRSLAGYNKKNKSGAVSRAKSVLGRRLGFTEVLRKTSDNPFVVEIETRFTGISGSVFNSAKNYNWWRDNMIEKLGEMDKVEGIKNGHDYVVEFEERT